MDVIEAIAERWSCRAFKDKAVDEATLRKLLTLAARAPSGVNHQPWQVAVVSGEIKKTLSEKIIATRRDGVPEDPDYAYYPEVWRDPYKTRRKVCGLALYSALSIAREDKARRQEVWELNYHFFNAPVGLIFLVEKGMAKGSWLDMGMFIQTTMLAARGLGLETCPEASLAEYPTIVRGVLDLPDNLEVVCGMAVGYADKDAQINSYRTEREDVDNFTRWINS